MANLCKCNNCDNTLIDQNPKENAPQLNLIGTELNMSWSGTESVWVCPVCRTNKHLTDIDKKSIEQRTRECTHTHAYV
jgi:rubrerythrin